MALQSPRLRRDTPSLCKDSSQRSEKMFRCQPRQMLAPKHYPMPFMRPPILWPAANNRRGWLSCSRDKR
ncbi:hypothetical protein E2C01_044227 [Portunus trituberculatus]|uniref:Uncharacterized protein n=1 Tax=Portunus trituberculatus TaxID=210409 RepID=A0A5B7FYR5_PORTR|nr:hypothetical protein [Portunus trituberculatus]